MDMCITILNISCNLNILQVHARMKRASAHYCMTVKKQGCFINYRMENGPLPVLLVVSVILACSVGTRTYLIPYFNPFSFLVRNTNKVIYPLLAILKVKSRRQISIKNFVPHKTIFTIRLLSW
jgi:hypothetical protein